MQVQTKSLDEFNTEAARFTRGLVRSGLGARIIALSGDLGAGKTTFVQAAARELGVEEQVSSPTFVIEKIYRLDNPSAGGFERLIHIDAYRLTGAHELEVLGWHEISVDPANLIYIEWPENAAGVLPVDTEHIKLEGSGDERTIIYGQ